MSNFKTPIWVVVADATYARIFLAPTAVAPLQEVADLTHPASRLKGRELVTDEPGRTFDRAGQHRHAKEQQVDPKREEAIRFAEELAAYLEKARAEGRFNELVLVAPPEFLGHLRRHLSDATRKLVEHEVAKDLVRLRPEEIRDHLPDYL